MAVAGNTTGAGGAKNLARVEKKRKQAKRTATLAASLPKLPAAPKQLPAHPTLRPAASSPVAKRASRVAVSAQRKRTGTDRPIIVKRRQDVEQQGKRLRQLETSAKLSGALASTQAERLKILERSAKSTGALAKGPVTPKKKEKKPAKGGVLGTATAATHLGLAAAGAADKLLSGKATQGAVSAIGDVAGKGLQQAVTGDWWLKKIGLETPKEGPATKAVLRGVRGLGKEAVDLPANVIPAVYNPAKGSVKAQGQLVTGHPEKAGKTLVKEVGKPLYEGAKESVTHPLDHPISAYLTVAGGAGALGRGGGFAARSGALGKGAKGAAKTAREAKVIPSTHAERHQTYSPDVLRKTGQVLGERRAAKRAAKRGEPSPKRRMSKRDVHSEVDDFIRTSRNVRGRAEERVTHEVADTLKHGKRRGRKATTHHTVAAQGWANATKADLQHLLAQVESAGKNLSGNPKRENAKRAEALREAIKEHTPEREAHVRETQKRYRGVDKRQEQEMADLNIVDPTKLDAARYTPAAVRHGLHDPEKAPAHQAMAKDMRVAATQEKQVAHRGRLDANAELRTMVEKTRAAELGPRGKSHPDVQKAERAHRDATKALDKTATELKARVDAAEAELTAARHDAAISTQKVSKTPEWQRAQDKLVAAQKELRALEKKHTGVQRGGGRLEGRAAEQSLQANARARGATRATARDVKRAADEVKTRQKTLDDLKAKGGTLKQIEIASKRLDLSKARHEAHVGRLRKTQEHVPGTEPRRTLERVERHGAAELDLTTQIERAGESVKAAELEVAKASRKFQGVPPAKADRLRNAIIEQAQARHAHRTREGIADARDAVTHAEGRLAYERSKRGLDPAAADRLWKAIGEAEAATKRHKDAVEREAGAVEHHRTMRNAPFIDTHGRPASVQDVASHPAMSGQPEPSFLPHAYERRVGAVPEQRVNIPNPQGRSGAMVAEGRAPVAGGHLLNARIERERLIEAAKSRNDFLDHFGYREHDNLVRYDSQAHAVKQAGEAEKATGVEMAPMHNQDGSWSLVPKDALKRLQDHEKAPTWADPIERLGRAWRQGVLAFSAKWLTGQAGEGSLRGAIHQGFNPVRLVRSHHIVSRTLDELRAMDPDAAARFETQYKRGGAGRTAKQSRDEAFHDFQMGESSGKLMSILHALQRRPTAQLAGKAYGFWQKFMFEWMNGGIETAVRRGMVGRELLADPIFRDKGIVVNFDKAAKELAQGQTNTAAQNRLARNVDDAYGKYQGRGPVERHVIENVTPFIPWFMSAMRFLYKVMPRDHPIMTGLVASANVSSEEWRKKYGLTADISTVKVKPGSDESLPLYQQGSLPIAGHPRNVSHYGPMGAMQALGDLGSFLVPQYNDIRAASKGEDWRGQPLTSRDDPPSLLRIMEALASAGVTTVVPPLGTAARVAGVHLPNVPDVSPDAEKTTLGQRLKKYVNPLPAGKDFEGGEAGSGALKLGAPLKFKSEGLKLKGEGLKFKDEPLK